MEIDSGRVSFKRHQKALFTITRIFKHLPFSFKQIVWNFFDNYENKLIVGVRYCILASSAKRCGENVFIGRRVIIKNIENLSLGSNVSIHSGCYIDAFGEVCIGDNVSIAHDCSLISFEHSYEERTIPIKYNPIASNGIQILDDVWIGCGSRVLAGVHIGSRTIIAAGSVLKGEADSGSIYGGVPAKKIKSI